MNGKQAKLWRRISGAHATRKGWPEREYQESGFHPITFKTIEGLPKQVWVSDPIGLAGDSARALYQRLKRKYLTAKRRAGGAA